MSDIVIRIVFVLTCVNFTATFLMFTPFNSILSSNNINPLITYLYLPTLLFYYQFTFNPLSNFV